MVIDLAKLTARDICRASKGVLKDSEIARTLTKKTKVCLSTTPDMIEKPESQDVWLVQDLFLTPPSSPCSLPEICSEDLETLEDISVPLYRKTDSILIKDCMWGAVENPHQKTREHSYTRLYLGEPPCGGKPLSLLDNSEISNKFLNTVDPSEVFPPVSCLEERMELQDLTSPESDDESDADVDVVTVEPKLTENEPLARSLDILTPPSTPDSEPTEGAKVFPQGAPMETNVATKTKSSNNENNATSKRSREVITLHERFSRASHNVLERKRRNELKGKFYSLRDSIDELKGNRKVPKVVILKKAISYVESVKEEENTLKTELQRQKKIHQDLRKRLTAILRETSVK